MDTERFFELFLSAGFIFGLRLTDMTLDTLRILFVLRGRKGVAWILGFFQSLVFVLAITSVMRNLNNPFNMAGYAAGFATGNVIGMLIEEKMALGYTHLRIISSKWGSAIAKRLREAGFGVTEVPGRGKDGMVTLLSCSVLRKQIGPVGDLIREVDENAFITAEDVRPLRRGFWRA